MAKYSQEFLVNFCADCLKANKEAQKVYDEKYKGKPDNGTCNFDTPYIYLKGLRESTAKKFGLVPFYTGKGTFEFDWNLYGQGESRTCMAETIKKYLSEKGYNAYVNYCMD